MAIQTGEVLLDIGAITCPGCGSPRTIEDICFKTGSVGMSTSASPLLCKKCKTMPYPSNLLRDNLIC